jgi:hypothetical protein
MSQPAVLFLQGLHLRKLAGGHAGVLFPVAIYGLVPRWRRATEGILATASISFSTLMLRSSAHCFPALTRVCKVETKIDTARWSFQGELARNV